MSIFTDDKPRSPIFRAALPLLASIALLLATQTHAAMLYKDYLVRYDRGWDILCDAYQVQQGDWVLKIFRQKGEIAHDDFREFLGIFERLNPHVKDIDRIRPGQVVDIPLMKLAKGSLPGQASGVVTIPFVMINNPVEMIKNRTRGYTVQRGDTVSALIAKQFGGRYGNRTFAQGLELFKAVNPHIADVNRIYAGQRVYMPDPSVREQSWYATLFDESDRLIDPATAAASEEGTDSDPPPQPLAPAAAASATGTPETRESVPGTDTGGPAAQAASVVGGRLLDKGTYFLPMRRGNDFELDLSRYPMIDFKNGSKVILTTQDRVMNVDLVQLQSYWDEVKVVQVPEDASPQAILEKILSAFSGEAVTNQLAFEDEGAAVNVSAKWIRTEPSPDGRVPRHTCITPITSDAERTHDAIVRYLDQNDIVIKEILTGATGSAPPSPTAEIADVTGIDGSSRKALVETFAAIMGFRYSPDTRISFPYAGIQIEAVANLLSFGNGREILIDFGDLYGDAVGAIEDTGLNILQVSGDDQPLDILQRLMETAGMAYTRSPVFYGADRPAEYNTAITINGILIPSGGGENRLFTEERLPDLIDIFIRDRDVRLVRIERTGSQS